MKPIRAYLIKFTFVLLALAPLDVAFADPCDACPPCVPKPPGASQDCTARDLCLRECFKPALQPGPSLEVVNQLRQQARQRLIQTAEEQRTLLAQHLASRIAELVAAQKEAELQGRRRIEQTLKGAREGMAPRMDSLRQSPVNLPQSFDAQLASARACLASPMPAMVTEAYAKVEATRRAHLGDIARLEQRINSQVLQLQASALRGLNEQVNVIASASRSIKSGDAIEAAYRQSLAEIDTNAGSPEEIAQRLKAILESQSPRLSEAAKKDWESIDKFYVSNVQAFERIPQQVGVVIEGEVDAAVDKWKVDLATRSSYSPSAVREFSALPMRLLATGGNGPKIIECLCMKVDLPPLFARDSSMPLGKLSLPGLSNMICTSAALIERQPKIQQGLISVRTARELPPPIDVDFSPRKALSAAGLKELREKADRYEQRFSGQMNVVDNIVFGCVMADFPDGARRLGSCDGTNASANSGLLTGKLLAARAYRFAVLKDEDDAATAAALKDLYASLSGLYNIMMLGEQIDKGAPIRRRDNGTLATPPDSSGFTGLPFRAYLSKASHELPSDTLIHLQPDVDPDGASHLFDISCLERTAEGLYLKGRCPEDPVASNGAVFVPESFTLAVKERESIDDSLSSLLGMAAAFDVLKSQLPDDPVALVWRDRIIKAVVKFSHRYTRAGFKLPQISNGQPGHFGDASDHRLAVNLLQNLAIMRVALTLAADTRAFTEEVKQISEVYKGLIAKHVGGVAPSFFPLGATASLARAMPAYEEIYLALMPAFTVDFLPIANYLLVRYEPDSALRDRYREIFKSVSWPLAEAFRVPEHTYMMLASLPPGSASLIGRTTGANRDFYLARAAATLRQFRKEPEPFGNPLPDSSDREMEGFYYSDFSKQAGLVDPLYFALRESWKQFHLTHPGIQIESQLAEDQGSLWPLGPGLVPKGRNSGPYGLIGGEWNDSSGKPLIFLEAPGGAKGIRINAVHDYLLAYWMGRFHKLLGG